MAKMYNCIGCNPHPMLGRMTSAALGACNTKQKVFHNQYCFSQSVLLLSGQLFVSC
jgi:hypothetical protein